MSNVPTVSKDEAVAGRWFDGRAPIVREVMRARDARVVVDGPLGTGKSRMLLEKARAFALKYPGCRVLLLRKFRKWLTETVLVTWEQEVVLKEELIPDRVQRSSRSIYRFRNGSEVVVAGLDDPQAVFSSQFDLILIFEATEVSQPVVEQVDGRLRNNKAPYQQLLMDCNPSSPNHWLHVKFTAGWCRRLPMRHTDNPALFARNPDGSLTLGADGEPVPTRYGRDYLARLATGLSGVRALRLLKGLWVQAEGVVYEGFDPHLHVKRRSDFPGWQARDQLWAVDFGFNDPFCYRGDTEVLTKAGWVRFDRLAAGVEVATVNPQTKATEWQVPVDYIRKPHRGELVVCDRGKKEGVAFAVTPDHHMVVERRRGAGVWRKDRADSLKTGTSIPTGWEPLAAGPPQMFRLPRRGRANRQRMEPVPLVDFARFLGLFIAEGDLKGRPGSRFVRIGQKKHVAAVYRAMAKLGLRVSSEASRDNPGYHQFSIGCSDLAGWLAERGCGGPSHLRRLPAEVFGWGADALAALIDGLMLGDGSPRRRDDRNRVNSGRRYHTSSPQLADDVQAVAALLGLPTAVNRSERKGGYPNPATDHMLYVSFHVRKRAAVESLKLRREAFDGDVYCVTVPNGMLVVRMAGRPMACGNCWQQWTRWDDDVWVLTREIHLPGLLVEDAAKLILIAAAADRPPMAVVCDHDREDRATLERHLGRGTVPANKKDVLAGINAVGTRLKPGANGKPRLLVCEDSLENAPNPERKAAGSPIGFVAEIETYQWKPNKDAAGGFAKDEPLDRDNHSMDACRYAVGWMDAFGARGPGAAATAGGPDPSALADQMAGQRPAEDHQLALSTTDADLALQDWV